MIIDAHAHAARNYATAESILSMSKKYGIDKILLCTSPKNNLDLKDPPKIPFMKSPNSIYLLNRMMRMAYRSFKDHGDGNQYVFELSKKLPEIVIPFLWVNPLDPTHLSGLEENLRACSARGIKLHQAWNAFAIDGPQFAQVVEAARAHKLPIFIHLYSKKETWKLLRFVESHPDVVVIVAHMLGLDIFKHKSKDLPNLYFDTSGSERVRGRDILEAIHLFGYEHVVFGSDTPYAGLGEQIDKIEKLSLPDSAKEHLYRLNIENLLSGIHI